jgi:acetyl-CoA C-acetyltransferase
MKDQIVIVGMARTPMGGFQGVLSSLTAPALGAVAIKAALERGNVPPNCVDETLMGCVLPAGIGQAPARQASIGAGIPAGTGCTTVNKMCGSGMKTVMLGVDGIRSGSAGIIVAGGMESMSNAPYLLLKARAGIRMGHDTVLDHMFYDGLEDAFEKGRLMGTFAEQCAGKYHFTREEQDSYAIESLTRAQNAIREGKFREEIVPVTINGRKEEKVIDTDEQPGQANIEKIPQLRPAFKEGGTVTAANSSSISDGAAALVLMSESEAEHRGLEPLARIIEHSSHAQEPAWFTTAPVAAIGKVLDKTGWSTDEVDLYEINEAFAVVPMAVMRELDLHHDKVNVNGGACALGHPVGASGARIIITLIAALKDRGLKRGVAGICIGGGEATAISLEIL